MRSSDLNKMVRHLQKGQIWGQDPAPYSAMDIAVQTSIMQAQLCAGNHDGAILAHAMRGQMQPEPKNVDYDKLVEKTAKATAEALIIALKAADKEEGGD